MSYGAHRAVTVLNSRSPDIGRMLWAIEDARQRTLSVLDHIPPAVIDWVPGPDQNTIGALLYHVAAIEASWLYEDVLRAGFVAPLDTLLPFDVRDANGKLTRVMGIALDDHLNRLSAVRGLLLNAYADMTPDDFRLPRRLDDYEVTPEWVLHHLMQHEAEHRGQIELLRQTGEAGLYGHKIHD